MIGISVWYLPPATTGLRGFGYNNTEEASGAASRIVHFFAIPQKSAEDDVGAELRKGRGNYLLPGFL